MSQSSIIPINEQPSAGPPKSVKKEPIAIVGIGCRFPGNINNPDEFWTALRQGFDAITDIPEERWHIDAFYDPNPNKAGKIKARKGGFVKDIDQFDADFFGIFPSEAQRIDPQQRLLLEITYEALEDAGIKMEDFAGSKTAVYMGVFMNDYWDIQASSLQREHISPHVPMGVSLTAIANRLSYVYDLKGPSLTLDTACSSSLVGVHLACQSIWSGESQQALAGGVNLILRPESSIMMSKGNFLSADGYCKPFDSRANGYVRSEGAGVVILKPLSQAEKDGDQIYAVVRGSAVNSDGYTEEGFTVPSVSSQVAMLQSAYEDACVDPSKVSYVEAHGTGTSVGDPIETKAFGTVLGRNREESCVIGSVKSNIGHLEAAAGMAGMIKLALSVKNKQIPQNLHFLKPNPNIPFEQYKLRVPTQLEPWPATPYPALGGVNSFGAGGTNAHVVLEEYQASKIDNKPTVAARDIQLFTLTARSIKALKANAHVYIGFLKSSETSLQDICFSAATRRSAHEHKLAIASRSKEELIAALEAFTQDETRPGMSYGKSAGMHKPKLGFIYSGQGPQWYAMGQQLLKTCPLFRQTLQKIDALFSEVADWSLLEEMCKDEVNSRVSDTRIAQPAIMAIQIGVTELWKSWGVLPDGCVGHSIGEVAAAYASGALTLAQAVEVIYHRSRGQNRATGMGMMLAVGMTPAAAKQEIKGLEAKISIAAINGPTMITLSGDTDALELVAEKLDKKDIFHRFLKVNVPFHSHHMDQLKDELISSLAHLVPAEAKLPLYSTVSGRRENGLHLLSEYWFDNVREPVYFTDAVQSMINDGFTTFIELAPHPVLTQGANELLAVNKKKGLIVPSLRRMEDEEICMMGSLGALFVNGYAVDWKVLFGEDCSYVKLPRYAWQKEKHWFETEEHRRKRMGSTLHPFLLDYTRAAADNNQLIWNINLDKAVFPYLEDHKVDGTIVFPGTGHLEVAQAVAQSSFADTNAFLEDIHFEAALFLPDEGEAPEIRLEISSDEGNYHICSRPRYGDDNSWSKHSRGKINYLSNNFNSVAVDLLAIKQRVNQSVSVADFYLELKEGGLQYGESFRCVQKLWTADKEVLGALSLDSNNLYGLDKYAFHPALLDACLHTLFAAKQSTAEEKRGIYLPVYIERMKVHQRPGAKVWTYIEVTEAGNEYLRGNYWIMNEDGELVAEIQGLSCKYIEGSRGEQKNELYKGMYEYQWELMENNAPEEQANPAKTRAAESTPDILIFEDTTGHSKTLLDQFRTQGLQAVRVLPAAGYREISPLQFEVNPASEEDLLRLFQRLNSLELTLKKVLYLWPLDSRFNERSTSEEMAAQQSKLTQATMSMLKALTAQGIEPAVWMITQGVEKITTTDHVVNLSQAAIYGMGRVLMNEYPFIPLRIVDVASQAKSEEWTNLLADFSSEKLPAATEIALRGTERYTRKLQLVTLEYAEEKACKELSARGSWYRADVTEYGMLDSVVFRQMKQSRLQPDEVEIEVRAAGLNFKDIMNVMGLLSDEAVEGGIAGKNLGLECAGVVTAVGADVTDTKVGDAVMAWASHSFAGYTVSKEHCVVPKPSHMSFEEAATLTVVYLTAYYSLYHLARLSAGDRVLIHAASGGVGLAAIQLAQLAGAEVIATAGNEEKRSYLRSLGIKYVFDSRSLSFADEVMKVTEGKGVDAVLNSLSGKGISQSIKCLAPFGTFIEIGKADIYNDARLSLKPFGNNLSYHAVDLDRLMLQKPKLGKRLFLELASLFEEGKLQAGPYTTYKIAELSEALKYLSKGVHIGKVVVKMDEQSLPVLPAKQLTLSNNATYIVTGGASGFGLELAKWLVARGGRHLVLLSRSGSKSESDREAIRHMEQAGARVELMNIDITSYAAVQQVISTIDQTMPPLKGIIHSAAVLDDATIANTDHRRFRRVFDPKVLGAWNLHLATFGQSLDFFLSLSSISAVFGLPGQANYSSANNFLDKLAHYRQSIGLTAQSVNLGVLGMYAGMSKEGGAVLNVLANQGWLPLSLQQVTDKLENILVQQPAQRMAANLDWKRFKDFFGHLNNDPRFAHLMSNEQLKNRGANGNLSLQDQILEAAPEEQQAMLQEKLVEALAKILGTSADRIDIQMSISKIGLDSLMLNQLRNWIQQKLEINYPLMKIAKGPSIAELSEQLIMEIMSQSITDTPNQDTSGIEKEEDVEVVNNWLIRDRNNAQEIETRVFCLHPVGAGASMFSHFMYNPPKNTDVLAFQLPGRENRSDEQPYEDVNLLVKDMAEAILPLLDKPFIIMGHSFGGIVGFELIRYLRRHYGKQPIHLFISGTIAPQLTKKWKERDVISETAIFTNSEEKLLALMSYIDDVDFLKRILPIMRKDMPLIMNYLYTDEALFDFPVTGFAADKDEVVLDREVACWKEQTTAAFSLEVVEGDHWFLSRNKELILQRLSQALEGSLIQ